jgi:hypothetical protein
MVKMTRQIEKDVIAIVKYLYAYERKHYEECAPKYRKNHIYSRVDRLLQKFHKKAFNYD